MDNSNIWLGLYLFAWVFTFYKYIKINRKFDCISLFYATLSIYALFSFVLYNDGFFQFHQITLLPFVYLFTMLYITSLPIRKYSTTQVFQIQIPANWLILGFCIIPIVCQLVSLPSTINNLSAGISNLFIDSSSVNDAYLSGREITESTGGGSVGNLTSVFKNAFRSFSILMLFTLLMLPKKNKLLIFAMLFCIVVGMLGSAASGERGGIFQIMISVLGTYFAIKGFFDTKTARVVRLIGTFIVGFIVVLVVIMTIGRFSSSDEGTNSYTYYYLGQQNLYFNNYALDDNGVRYGDRTIPLFKKMVGFSNVPNNFIQRRAKYPQLYINDEVFCTYIGDFAIDYGPIGAVLLLLLLTLWIWRKTAVSNGVLYFHQLVLLHLLICICMQGGLELFQFADTAGNLQIIVYVIAYILSKNFISPIFVNKNI